jgi:hypothetical protein
VSERDHAGARREATPYNRRSLIERSHG